MWAFASSGGVLALELDSRAGAMGRGRDWDLGEEKAVNGSAPLAEAASC